MFEPSKTASVDLSFGGGDSLQPVPMLVNLALEQAVYSRAERIEFLLTDAKSHDGFRMAYYAANGERTDLPPAAGSLFEPAMVVLCNYASVSYYKKGKVKGRFTTQSPSSSWDLESEDLTKKLLLKKT